MTESTEQMEKVTQGLIQACDEMGATYSKSLEAAMESASAFTKGCDELNRNIGSIIQEQVARALSASKTIMSAKSIKEVTDLQAEFAKDCFDRWMSSTGRLSEISARVTQDAFTPVARHAGDAISKATEKARQGRAA